MMDRLAKRIVLSGLEVSASERPPAATSGSDSVASPEPGSAASLRRADCPVWPDRAAWLVAPLMLAAVAAAVLLVMRGPQLLFGAALVVLFGIGFVWMLVSVFFPAAPDRTCPACGADALERLDPAATSGVRCAACGFCDASASAWLLAEEEGPLERTVLRERALRRFRRSTLPADQASTAEAPPLGDQVPR